jgi:hypothetical protein
MTGELVFIGSEAVQRNRPIDLVRLNPPLAKARTAEGRERAKSRGVRMGRKHELTMKSGSGTPRANRFGN